MGMLGRLAGVMRSHINQWVDGTADPEKNLNQAVAEMQADLIQLRQSVAQAIATQKRTERQSHQTATLVREWYNRAQLALNQGREDQARDALAQRQAYLKMQIQLKHHLQDQASVIQRLKTNMRDLEVKIADVRTRRDMYIARARSAEASQRIQDLIGQVGRERSLGTLGQMEDKVLDLEAQADATMELNRTLSGQALEDKFAELEQADAAAIETELSAMKGRSQRR